MKAKVIFSTIIVSLLTLGAVLFAADPRGAGGGGHVGGAAHSSFSSAGHSGFYYSRGMQFARARGGQFHSPVHQPLPITGRGGNGGRQLPTQATTGGRPKFNSGMAHVAERHNANWHRDWDQRHAHYYHHRFFVFIDGFWCGLDDGLFPWDYYPYYAYDYYPYDYYPGYYADEEPYYYTDQVYSETPVRCPTVTAVQTALSQLGYYTGPIDGIFGPSTRDAVGKYQIANNLEVTGSLSPDTLQSLGLPQAPAS